MKEILKKVKRSLACLLVLAMCVSLLERSTFTSAAEAAGETPQTVSQLSDGPNTDASAPETGGG